MKRAILLSFGVGKDKSKLTGEDRLAIKGNTFKTTKISDLPIRLGFAMLENTL